MNSSNKRLYLLIIIAVALVSIVASISYGFFSSDLNNKNIGNYTIVLGDDYTLSTNGGNPVNYTVNDADMFGVSDNIVAVNKNSTLNIILENKGTGSVTCTYDFIWRWDTTTGQYTKSLGVDGSTKKEFTVTITGTGMTNQSGQEQQIPDFSGPSTVLGKGSITATGGNTTNQQADINIKFYNLSDVDQQGHKGKNYKGGIVLSNVTCTKP